MVRAQARKKDDRTCANVPLAGPNYVDVKNHLPGTTVTTRPRCKRFDLRCDEAVMSHMLPTRERTRRGLKRPRELHQVATFYRTEHWSQMRSERGTIGTPSELETRRRGELTERYRETKLERLPQIWPERV